MSLRPSIRVAGAREARNLVFGGVFAVMPIIAPWSSCLGETVRVTAWNLHGVADQPLLNQVAADLKSLKPDVILLQGVRDWQMCGALAEALQPERYNVLVCSSFRTFGEPVITNNQVAVLAKVKAYFSWSEPWRGSNADGGFTFVAMACRGQRLGFISAKLGEPAAPGAIASQLRQQTDAVTRWEVNRVHSFVIGLSCEGVGAAPQAALQTLVAMLQEAGYTDTFDALADDQRITVAGGASQAGRTCDYILAQPTVFPSPQRPRTSVMGRYPVTCDFELEPALVAAAWTARAQELRLWATAIQAQAASSARQPQDPKRMSIDSDGPPAWWWFFGGVMATAMLFLLWFISRTARRMPRSGLPLLANHTPLELTAAASYTVVVSAPPEIGHEPAESPCLPQVPTVLQFEVPRLQVAEPAKVALQRKLARRISRWLKQKFVRKMITDRAKLLLTQQNASLRAIEVDQRLAQIEKQIQQQTSKYERHIKKLTLELEAAREDNREFIRARIAQIKLEMDGVRARLRAQARENADSDMP